MAQPAPGSERRPRARPAVDERLVMPETRYEVIDGKIEYVPPADEPHGTRHSKLSAILEIYAGPGYDVASDMLTRTSEKEDMAPDASVFPQARDPETGGRQLEELAFEVLSTERLGHAARKARELTGRGVRRVFAINVERRRALEWSPGTDTWEMLPPDGVIDDPALALPLPLRPLVEAAKADDAIAAALLVKKNPLIEKALQRAKLEGLREGKREGKSDGIIEGKLASLFAILAARGIRVSKKAEKRLRATRDEFILDGWIRRAVDCASVDALLDPPHS
jgi:Uma2 family endonuclease